MNHVAGIHKPQADGSINGRTNVAVGEVQLGAVDLRVVGAYQAFLLRDHRLLGVVLLLSNDALLVEIGVALQVADVARPERGIRGARAIEVRCERHPPVASLNTVGR